MIYWRIDGGYDHSPSALSLLFNLRRWQYLKAVVWECLGTASIACRQISSEAMTETIVPIEGAFAISVARASTHCVASRRVIGPARWRLALIFFATRRMRFAFCVASVNRRTTSFLHHRRLRRRAGKIPRDDRGARARRSRNTRRRTLRENVREVRRARLHAISTERPGPPRLQREQAVRRTRCR